MTAPVKLQHGRAPLGITEVTLTPGSYLRDLQDLNATATLPHAIGKLDESGVIANLASPGGEAHRGFGFSDSDLYKTLEAIGWEIARTGTTAFDGFLDSSYRLLRAAQQPDGYLNSWGLSADSPGRWVDLQWGHELYCAGHLIQAAVALNRAGRGELMAIARPVADLIVRRFAHEGTCGHPEIETALVELYRETGEPGYLTSAKGFVERRGNPVQHTLPFGPAYFQDHAPVRDAQDATGHAVRQLYLDAGCVDVAVETGDTDLLEAVQRRWDSAHGRRMFITGGMGSHFQDESFGDDHELASERSYAETCAAIADLHLSWRLLLATGEARYAQAMERVLYNAIPAAVSEDGRAFTYANPLQVRTGGRVVEYNSGRQPWFSCACCPPNVARLRASLAAYLAFADDEGLAIALPADATLALPAEVGTGRVVITGDLEAGSLTVTPEADFRPGKGLRVRIPEWATSPQIDGAPAAVERGWLSLDTDAPSTITLDVSPTAMVADARVDAVRGSVAIQAGPTVLCAEAHDNREVDALAIDPNRPLTGDPTGATGSGAVLPTSNALYRRYGDPTGEVEATPVTLIPYREWGRRGRVAMRVWLPTVDL